MNKKDIICPVCGKPLYKVLYGEPSMTEEEYFKTYGEHVVYGGCCISDNAPTLMCSGCKRKFNPNRPQTYLPLPQKVADESMKDAGFAKYVGKIREYYIFVPCLYIDVVNGFEEFIIVNQDTLELSPGAVDMREIMRKTNPRKCDKGKRILEKLCDKYKNHSLTKEETKQWGKFLKVYTQHPEDILTLTKSLLYTYVSAADRLGMKLDILKQDKFTRRNGNGQEVNAWTYTICIDWTSHRS